MCQKFTPDELNKMDHQSKNDVICQMQERLDKLEHDYENLIEQIRLANQQKFGRSTEKLSEITGQLAVFNEPGAFCDCEWHNKNTHFWRRKFPTLLCRF